MNLGTRAAVIVQPKANPSFPSILAFVRRPDAACLSGLRSSIAILYIWSRSFEPLADIFAIKKNVCAIALNLLHLPNINKGLEQKEPSVHKSINEAALGLRNPLIFDRTHDRLN